MCQAVNIKNLICLLLLSSAIELSVESFPLKHTLLALIKNDSVVFSSGLMPAGLIFKLLHSR